MDSVSKMLSRAGILNVDIDIVFVACSFLGFKCGTSENTRNV